MILSTEITPDAIFFCMYMLLCQNYVKLLLPVNYAAFGAPSKTDK